MTVVMKFGGTSLGSPERIKKTGEIIRSRLSENPVVVVSAMSGITNLLFAAMKDRKKSGLITQHFLKTIKELDLDEKIIEKELKEMNSTFDAFYKLKEVAPVLEASKRLTAMIASFGERITVRIVSAYWDKMGLDTKPFDAWQIGLITDSKYRFAKPLDRSYSSIKKKLKTIKSIPVITGYISRDKNKEITTLGRGGSDYSASIIGNAINADRIEIWTDVNGIMTCDPRIVKNARTIDGLSYNEASELAFFGAKVLHPKTILPAIKKSIPVAILNSFNPSHKGTMVLKHSAGSKEEFKGIAFKENMTAITVHSFDMIEESGFMSLLFDVFKELEVSVDFISTGVADVTVILDTPDKPTLKKIISSLNKHFTVEVENKKSVVCLIGQNIKFCPGVAGRAFSLLGKHGINIEVISQGASKINLSFVVKNEDAEKAIKLLHREFL